MSSQSSQKVEELRVVNLTPHNVVVRPSDGGADIVYPSAGVASLEKLEEQVRIGSLVDGSPLFTAQKFGRLLLPALPDDTTHVLVSMPIGNALRDDDDDFKIKYEGDNRERLAFDVCGPDSARDAMIYGASGLVATRRLVLYGRVEGARFA